MKTVYIALIGLKKLDVNYKIEIYNINTSAIKNP